MPNVGQVAAGTRIERERIFHDVRFTKNPSRRWSLSALMNDITLDAIYLTYNTARPYCKDAVVLDYGCAQGEASLILRRYGAAHVDGIDISPVAVDQASAAAKEKGVEGVRFQVMDGHALTFDDARFDLVFGIGILHHLDFASASREIARVLKKDGVGIFLEPLGHNPAINLVRRWTPQLRTPDERPLRMADLQGLRTDFGTVEMRFVNLSTLFSVPFAHLRGGHTLRRMLGIADRGLFTALPFCRWFAWNVLITVGRPTIDRPSQQSEPAVVVT
jgi:SAM-dependent methyltransferase